MLQSKGFLKEMRSWPQEIPTPGPGPLTTEPQLKARALVPSLSECQAGTVHFLGSNIQLPRQGLHFQGWVPLPIVLILLEIGSLLRWSVTKKLC